jgi:hypothetical protein
MKAVRWILYCLVCFGAGTGIALAVDPPTVGIPAATAASLRDRLERIEELASEGRCSGVEGQLEGAQSEIDNLPPRTNDEVVQSIQNRLDEVRRQALAECRRVQAELEAATTPDETPTPEATPEPTPEPTPTLPPVDPGAGDGGPDPGSGEGQTTPGEADDPGTGGGVPIPDGALRQRLEAEARERLREALERSIDEVMGQ